MCRVLKLFSFKDDMNRVLSALVVSYYLQSLTALEVLEGNSKRPFSQTKMKVE